MENYYDCHCHVFTRKETINLRLIIQVIFSLPNIFKREHDINIELFDGIKDKIETLKRILNFLKTGMSDSEENIYELMESVYNNKFNIVPLMFDLECCFVSNRTGEQKNLNIDIIAIQQQFEKSLNDFDTNTKQYIQNATQIISAANYSNETEYTKSDLQELYMLHNDVINLLNNLKNEQYVNDNLLGKLADSYNIQLDDITDLKTKFPNNVFPFIAIDPRRKGIIEKFKTEIYQKNIFCGVKLYTPNGYSPTDDDFMGANGLYQFCSDNNIPITAHNSHSGFATPLQEVEITGDVYLEPNIVDVHNIVNFSKAFSDEWVEDRAEKLNNPKLWDIVLSKFPNLKLNLAHFAAGKEAWQVEIFEMMKIHKNLYTDLSCWTNKTELMNFRENYFLNASTDVKSRILYGSDFYLDLLFINSFQEYVTNFHQVFTSEEFTQIAQTNAKQFLFTTVV